MTTYCLPCPKLRLVYVQVPKAANSSIIHSLNKTEDWFDSSILNHQQVQNKVRKYKRGYKQEFREEFKDYLWFTFVRNPYSRILSAFINKVLEPKKVFGSFAKMGVKKETSFDEFCEIISTKNPHKLNDHIKPQSLIIPQEMTYIGRTERFSEDWDTLKNYKKNLSDVEVLNKSLYPIDKNSLTTNRSITLINDIYKEDFSRFKYPITRESHVIIQ